MHQVIIKRYKGTSLDLLSTETSSLGGFLITKTASGNLHIPLDDIDFYVIKDADNERISNNSGQRDGTENTRGRASGGDEDSDEERGDS